MDSAAVNTSILFPHCYQGHSWTLIWDLISNPSPLSWQTTYSTPLIHPLSTAVEIKAAPEEAKVTYKPLWCWTCLNNMDISVSSFTPCCTETKSFNSDHVLACCLICPGLGFNDDHTLEKQTVESWRILCTFLRNLTQNWSNRFSVCKKTWTFSSEEEQEEKVTQQHNYLAWFLQQQTSYMTTLVMVKMHKPEKMLLLCKTGLKKPLMPIWTNLDLSTKSCFLQVSCPLLTVVMG